MVGLFGLGQVNLYFCHMNLKKKKCIWQLENHVANYLV